MTSEVFHDAGGVYAGTDQPYLFGRRRVSGPDPEHRSYRSFVSFSDPDGNGWLLQEVRERLPGRGVTLNVAGLAELLHERPNITARSRRSPRSTTGGTGTPRTWMLASVEAHRRRRPRQPRAIWRTSSTLSSRPREHGERDHAASPFACGGFLPSLSTA